MPSPDPRSSARRLAWSLCLSLVLHLAFLGLPALWANLPMAPPKPLQVSLTPAQRLAIPKPAQDLLKDTLAKEEKAAPKPAAAPQRPTGNTGRPAKKLNKAREAAAQKKLARHLYYPEEAVRLGLEGDVSLLLILDASGRVLSADVAAGSGHPLLDEAARKAALAMGSLPDAGVTELILPVVFRLQ